MKEYSFHACRTHQQGPNTYLAVGDRTVYKFSPRLALILSQLRGAYVEAFPEAPRLRLGLLLEDRNGASSRWSLAESSAIGPTFLVELDPSLERDEAILAHELVHPIIRLLGVPTGSSVGGIDHRIGDEFTSTSHHPFVFRSLDLAGYTDEQSASYSRSAAAELTKLGQADWTNPTYTAPPGQTWLALWYFNFYLLARSEYETIFGLHEQHAPGVATKMSAVVEGWRVATRGNEVLKPSAGVKPILAFQGELMNRLDLHGLVSLQSFANWSAWLFQGVRRNAP